MHWQVRSELRNIFFNEPQTQPTTEDDRIDIQVGLADWCMTLFHATRDPLAAFQAIFHRCRVAQFAWRMVYLIEYSSSYSMRNGI